jgi:hypothetical protein
VHDSHIENQVRAALRDEADRLPMTITSAELERRLGARRRAAANRRFRFAAAAVAAVLVVAIVAGGNGWLNLPAVGGIVVPSATPTPTTPPIPTATPHASVATPVPSARIREARELGSEGEAILVKPVGSDLRPDAFEVSRFDPITGNSTPVATIPGTVLPPDAQLSVGERPSVSLTGYLAIPIERGETADTTFVGFAVVDLTDPSIPPVIFDRYDAMSWDVADGLALMQGDHVDTAFASSNQVFPFADPGPSVSVARADYSGGGPVTSTQEGSRFLATKTDGDATTWGALGFDSVFRPTSDLPRAYQRTGLERPAGSGAHAIGPACDSSAVATPCALVEHDAVGAPIRNFPMTAGNFVSDHVWARDGRHLWMLLDDGSEDSAKVSTLTYATIEGMRDGVRDDRARLDLPGVQLPSILGIGSETDDGRALVVVGDAGGFVRAFVGPDGNVTPQDGTAWFAGWAGMQPDYDPD